MQNDDVLCRRALEGAAQLVDLHGEEFLPLFLRLEAELQSIEKRKTALERARVLARATGSTTRAF